MVSIYPEELSARWLSEVAVNGAGIERR